MTQGVTFRLQVFYKCAWYLCVCLARPRTPEPSIVFYKYRSRGEAVPTRPALGKYRRIARLIAIDYLNYSFDSYSRPIGDIVVGLKPSKLITMYDESQSVWMRNV